jgi:hypothetical protein
MQHHEIDEMPNGHVLAIVWERIPADEAMAAGRDPDLLPDDEVWPDKIVEYDPVADDVVWEWRVWDHLVQGLDPEKPNYVQDVSTRPERIDLNFVLDEDVPGQADWNHLNGVNYNAERDEIVLSSRSFSELWVIDHDTTTESARGPAGDLKFRYGNPRAYGDDRAKRRLFFQHDAEWIEPGLPGEGNVLVLNNGAPKIREVTTVDEIVPTLDDNGDYVRDPDGGFEAKSRRAYPKNRDDDEGDFAATPRSRPRGDPYGQGRVGLREPLHRSATLQPPQQRSRIAHRFELVLPSRPLSERSPGVRGQRATARTPDHHDHAPSPRLKTRAGRGSPFG